MKKHLLFVGLLVILASNAYSVWDKTLPLGSESKSLGDDRIREMKTDIEDALNYEGEFPGEDTSDPRFIYTPSTGTTGLRPSGSTNTATGMLFINVSSGCIEQFDGANWNCVPTIPNTSITSIQISTTVIGNGLSGGGGAQINLNADPSIFQITNDSITFITGGITGTKIASSTIQPINISTYPKFFVYMDATDTNSTGDGTFVELEFPGEKYDTGNMFSFTHATISATGYYNFVACTTMLQTASNNYTCYIGIRKNDSDNGYPITAFPAAQNTSFDSTTGCVEVTDLYTVSDRISVFAYCDNSSKTVDIEGDGASGNMPTFFMGTRIP